jgi:hypothetical protein
MPLRFVIEEPPSAPRIGRPPKYDLDGMEVGDSFWMPAGAATTDITGVIAGRRHRRGWDRVFRTRTVEGRVLVERIA